ncbi:MAG: glycoside hydrolase family 18 protein [Gemmataceae bacterium]
MRTRWCALLMALMGLPTVALGAGPMAPGEVVVAGYLPDYRAASFDPEALRGLTDLLVFSAEPTATGPLNLSRVKAMPWARLRAYKTRARVRLWLSVGGWERSGQFATVTASAEKRKAFVESAVRVCLEHRLDGLDLDWEHPQTRAEQDGYAALLADLRRGFEPHGLMLSLTMAGWQQLPRAAFAAVDRIHLMAYDQEGRHATFEGARKEVELIKAAGAPVGKLVLGMPFYGRGVEQRSRTLTYAEIVEKFKPKPEVDEVEGVYFNGPALIRRKTTYAVEQGLAGVMVWELGQDARGARSLLGVVRETLEKQRR